jgi:hypothetical protein
MVNASWAEFEAAFYEHHVPAGIIQLKEEEFRELVHGGHSVSEYIHKFIELARYVPDDMSTEARKMSHLLRRIRLELKAILSSHDFNNFCTSPISPFR